MATRADIKDVLYSGLVSASSGYVAQNDIRPYYTGDETSPSIVWRETYRELPINQASGSPDHVEYSGGVVQYEEYREYEEAIFTIRIRADDEGSLEDIYESVHTYFGKYDKAPWDHKDLHPHIERVQALDTFDSDDRTADHVFRTDVIQVRIMFYRVYQYTDNDIREISIDVDGQTYTVN